MTQEKQPSESENDRVDKAYEAEPVIKPLSEMGCDRKAMLFWSRAGKPEGQYSVYRKATEKWSQAGAQKSQGGTEEDEFDHYLKAIRDALLSEKQKQKELQDQVERKLAAKKGKEAKQWRTSIPNSWLWPWVTALVIPVFAIFIAAWVVFVEIAANRESLEKQISESRDALQKSFEAQNEQNRQQILKDYIAQMTSLIADKDLAEQYPKNAKEKYDPTGTQDPDAMAATSLTKTVLKLLAKTSSSLEDNSFNLERGSLVIFLHENKLIQSDKPVIKLNGADLRGANLRAANLQKADLSGGDFQGANLEEANLEEANLEGVNLEEAHLVAANLSKAYLRESFLRETNFSLASLNGANLSGVDFSGHRVHRNNKYIFGIISGAHLEGVDLSGADLRGANLEGVNLTGAIFRRARLQDAKLLRVQVKIQGKAFKGQANIADFREAMGLTEEQKVYLKSRGALVDDPPTNSPDKNHLESVTKRLLKARLPIPVLDSILSTKQSESSSNPFPDTSPP